MSYQYFHPETRTVVSLNMFGQLEYTSYLEAYARGFVIQHLSYTGRYRDILTPAEWQQAYLMCDGFGTINKEWAEEQSWDWSHVRDSKSETFVKVADWIARKWHLGSIQAIVDDMIEQCGRVGIDPIKVIP